ncbi:MAG TPA: NUDIX hydrolase [Mycobacteriales bacterium]|nr:NUDIX hydrolase [Mycobacteriales bacterium]
MGAVIGVLAAIGLLGLYLSWTAGRIDRLHARLEAAAATLDAQLVRRAAAAAGLAGSGRLPVVVAERLAAAARAAQAVDGLQPDREAAENALSRRLNALAEETPEVFEASAELATASLKVGLARRFHNDAVRDTLNLRRRRIPRLFRLAGRAALPGYFEIDDSPLPPPGR